MPTYEFECTECGNRHEVILKISEYDAYPKVCSNEKVNQTAFDVDACGGKLTQVYDSERAPNHVWIGGRPTPRFGPVNRG